MTRLVEAIEASANDRPVHVLAVELGQFIAQDPAAEARQRPVLTRRHDAEAAGAAATAISAR